MSQLVELNEKGKLLRDAMRIIEKLSKSDLADTDYATDEPEEAIDELKQLIIDARALTSNGWWKNMTT